MILDLQFFGGRGGGSGKGGKGKAGGGGSGNSRVENKGYRLATRETFDDIVSKAKVGSTITIKDRNGETWNYKMENVKVAFDGKMHNVWRGQAGNPYSNDYANSAYTLSNNFRGGEVKFTP